MADNIKLKDNLCQQCLTPIPLSNRCDFCNLRLCETCLDNSYYSFHHCDECEANWCYFDGKYNDYPCQMAPSSSNCQYCGH